MNCAGVTIEAGGDVDRNDGAALVVDPANGAGHRLAHRPLEAGAEQPIHDHGRLESRQSGRRVRLFPVHNPHTDHAFELRAGVAFEIGAWKQQHQGRFAARRGEMPGGDKRIATVVAFPGEKQRDAGIPAFEEFDGAFGDRVAGVFHEDLAGCAGGHGAVVQRADLFGRNSLHTASVENATRKSNGQPVAPNSTFRYCAHRVLV